MGHFSYQQLAAVIRCRIVQLMFLRFLRDCYEAVTYKQSILLAAQRHKKHHAAWRRIVVWPVYAKTAARRIRANAPYWRYLNKIPAE